MDKNTLLRSITGLDGSVSSHDQIQIALAIADQTILKSLLLNCIPSIAQPHWLGEVTSTVGVPLKGKKSVDGIIQFESIQCVLSDTPAYMDPQSTEASLGNYPRWRHLSLTCCESETHILGQALSLAQAISVLSHAGFSPQQVDAILNLPYEAWHKTWWFSRDVMGDFSLPFLRLIRTLRYTDGTFTIQYKDYYSQDKPPCFKSVTQKVLIDIKTPDHSFKKTLEKINYSRETCGIETAILICDTLSDIEARGFINQGISIYTAKDLILPIYSNCVRCVRACPMQGRQDSPVVLCRQFCLNAASD